MLLKKHRGNPDHRKDGKAAQAMSLAEHQQSVAVLVRYAMLAVSSIDTLGQNFSCDFFVEFHIRDKRLGGKSVFELEENDFEVMNDFFCPVFLNMTKKKKIEKWLNKDHKLSTDVRLRCRVSGTFMERTELEKFPFDEQDLSVRIVAKQPLQKIYFAPMSDYSDFVVADMDLSFILSDWVLVERAFSTASVLLPDQSSTQNYYSQYLLTVKVRREFHYHVWNFYFIMFLIVSCLAFLPTIAVTDSNNRLNYVVTLLLSAVAFKYSISQSVPKIAYSTLLDNYVIGCFSVLVTVMLECLLVSVKTNLQDIDTGILGAIGILWLCFNVIHITYATTIVQARSIYDKVQRKTSKRTSIRNSIRSSIDFTMHTQKKYTDLEAQMENLLQENVQIASNVGGEETVSFEQDAGGV